MRTRRTLSVWVAPAPDTPVTFRRAKLPVISLVAVKFMSPSVEELVVAGRLTVAPVWSSVKLAEPRAVCVQPVGVVVPVNGSLILESKAISKTLPF